MTAPIELGQREPDGIRSQPAATAPGAGLRLIVRIAIVIALVPVLASLLAPSFFVPSGRSLYWHLNQGFGGQRFDPGAADTTRVVAVEVEWPACAGGGMMDDSWIGRPAITYTPFAVIITTQTTEAFETRNCQGGWFLTGKPYIVQLSESLGGRPLFDGSVFPPAARPYP